MNRDDIIRMAREATRYACHQTNDSYEWQEIRDERFANLVAAAERDAILSATERLRDREIKAAAHHAGRMQDAYEWHMTREGAFRDVLDYIRARGEK
jgi:hypothetical protein